MWILSWVVGRGSWGRGFVTLPVSGGNLDPNKEMTTRDLPKSPDSPAKTTFGVVRRIRWSQTIPVALVEVLVDGVGTHQMSEICLLHSTVLERHQIRRGSILRVWKGRYFVSCVSQPEGSGVRPPQDQTVFDRWFVFRQLAPKIPLHILRLLFLSGLETVQALLDQQETIEQIKGIGPSSREKIRLALSG